MPYLFLPPHILRMTSTLCSQCVQQALDKNAKPQCTFISKQQGCKFGDNCVNRHQTVCKNIGHCKAHDKGDCDMSHTLPPCTHRDAPAARASARASARAPPPAPVLIQAPRAQAAAPAPTVGEDSKLVAFAWNPEVSTYVSNDELIQEIAYLRQEKDALNAENANLYDENESIRCVNTDLRNRNGALIYLLKGYGMTNESIASALKDLMEQPEEYP